MEKGLEERLNDKLVSSQLIFEGMIIKVQVDTVELPDGKTAKEVVKHPGTVVILPLTARVK